MKLHYATYVDGDYFEKMWSQHTLPFLQSQSQVTNPYYYNIRRFDRSWLETTKEYKKNPEKFSRDLRGAGYWRWKPLVIKETLNQIEDGDAVCYFDCADMHRTGFHDFAIQWFEKYKGVNVVSADPEIEQNNGSFILVPLQVNEPLRKWTRRDAFHYLECDTEECWNTLGVEAGMVCFMKCQESLDFVDEWFAACMDDRNIVEDMDENLCGKENLPEFIDHRHDQSLLSILHFKHGLPKLQYNGYYVEGNCFNRFMEEQR